jgi:hypothetical protein
VPRSEVVFFLDRSIGKHIVALALRDRGARVELHDDHFERSTEDPKWIAEVSRRGWAIITKDRRIRHRPLERAAVVAARARMFALTGGNLTGAEMALILGLHLTRMQGLAMGQEPPFIAKVTRTRITVERLRR